MKSKQLCVHKYVYDVCKYTCGCWDVLSYESCKILKTYNRCHVPVFRSYCAKTCNYCPHLHKGKEQNCVVLVQTNPLNKTKTLLLGRLVFSVLSVLKVYILSQDKSMLKPFKRSKKFKSFYDFPSWGLVHKKAN